jgi:hypothetical protein
MKKQWISILIVAMTLGTAWAIRGQFGHEQGAAWAGGIGALALVLASKRKDWYSNVFSIVFAAAIGWGASGMISYGQVVGYGRSDNFLNAFYGLLMLFVIGSLYGILGGGLVGLSLHSSEKNKVKWGAVLSEMVAGGFIGYNLLIGQFEWLMTPPREEAWAVCLGAGFALLWHMARNNCQSPIRVALYSAIGAGFGFAFGNFLQTLGTVLEISFNMWNVMEYSIGFFGGAGMAYGVFSSQWKEESALPEHWETRVAMLVVFVAIPFVIMIESLGYNTLMERIKDKSNPEFSAMLSSIFGTLIILSVAVFGYKKSQKPKTSFEDKDVRLLLITYLAAYISISYIVSGCFAGNFPLNHQLYLVNFLIILVLFAKQFPSVFPNPIPKININQWWLMVAGIVVVIALLALISINIHGEMSGAKDRF